METISILGIDLAKKVFQVHGVGESGKPVVRRKYSRSGLLRFVGSLKPCLIGLEATGGSRYWVRELSRFGHDVKLIAPQFVKPFVKSDKNDANDAEAICEAVQRPNMRFVAPKTQYQQDIQTMHRVRSRRITARTELCNEIRAILSDEGIVVPLGLSKLKSVVQDIMVSNKVSENYRRILETLFIEWSQLDTHIARSETCLSEVYESNATCQRLTTIPGVGKLTATAIVGTVGDITNFKSGRHLSAWLGLVPKQHSSGGKQKLSGITKRGDKYLRSLLVHGGRSVVRTAGAKQDKRSRWITEKAKTRGKNKAAVAVANKNARVIWKLLSTEETYKVA
jgi:transposase